MLSTSTLSVPYLRVAALLFIPIAVPGHAKTPHEIEHILALEPDIEAGKTRFESCTHCHGADGWGAYSGAYPQIAGQHASVVIKQLTDISSGQRENPEMLEIARGLSTQGPQAMSDVAAYIESLKMNPDPGVGYADDDILEGASKTFQQVCSTCHGVDGEGHADDIVPLLQGQNFEYLLRQLKRIQAGTRKNSNPDMRKLIRQMTEEELELLATYISRLEPPESKLAPFD